MPSPTEQLNQDLAKKRGARLGGRRTDQFAPGEDVGYIEYDGQSPDIGNAVAAYDGTSEQMMEPQQGSGFAGTAMDSLVEPEPAATRQTPVMQASMQGDDGEVIQTGCPGGVCRPGNASAAPQRIGGDDLVLTPPAQREIAESGEQAQSPVDYSLVSNIPITRIDIPNPVTGEITGSIPMLQTEGLMKYVDAMGAKANEAAQRQSYQEYVRFNTMAKMGMQQVLKSQALHSAALGLANSLQMEHELFKQTQPDYRIQAELSVLSDPKLTPTDAAREITISQIAEIGLVKQGEQADETLPQYQELYAQNLNRAHSSRLSQSLFAIKNLQANNENQLTPEAVEAAKQSAVDVINNTLLSAYKPFWEEQGQDAFEGVQMYNNLYGVFAPDMMADLAGQYEAEGRNPLEANALAMRDTARNIEGFRNTLVQIYTQNGVYDTQPKSPMQVVEEKAGAGINETMQFFESVVPYLGDTAVQGAGMFRDTVDDYVISPLQYGYNRMFGEAPAQPQTAAQ